MSPQKILVIATHPDDETLGVGGTLLKHKEQGDFITWLVMTHILEDQSYSPVVKEKRSKEIERVASLYSFAKTIQFPYQATRLDTYPMADIVGKLNQVLQETKPNILYLPNRSDVHSDHRVTFRAAFASSKAFRNPSLKRVLMYETISETDLAPPFIESAFVPNFFVDISPYLKEKLAIMEVYESELGVPPFPRSQEALRALATLRGSISHVKYAEAFMLIREVA